MQRNCMEKKEVHLSNILSFLGLTLKLSVLDHCSLAPHRPYVLKIVYTHNFLS